MSIHVQRATPCNEPGSTPKHPSALLHRYIEILLLDACSIVFLYPGHPAAWRFARPAASPCLCSVLLSSFSLTPQSTVSMDRASQVLAQGFTDSLRKQALASGVHRTTLQHRGRGRRSREEKDQGQQYLYPRERRKPLSDSKRFVICQYSGSSSDSTKKGVSYILHAV